LRHAFTASNIFGLGTLSYNLHASRIVKRRTLKLERVLVWKKGNREISVTRSCTRRLRARKRINDRSAGQELSETKLGEINEGEAMTTVPLVVKDKVMPRRGPVAYIVDPAFSVA
jgi:hypothetical protein